MVQLPAKEPDPHKAQVIVKTYPRRQQKVKDQIINFVRFFNFISPIILESIKINFNNAYKVDNVAVCGTRGWFFDCSKDEDQKVLAREVGRLKTSIAEAKKLGGEVIAFLHYPPISLTETCHEIYDTLVEEQIRNCYYGHLHGNSVNWAFRGEGDGVNFDLISADYLSFCPKLIRKF